MNNKLRYPYQGQLIKFTNVVKGWQARWFLLDPENGILKYYLSETEKREKARGSIKLVGAVISPSDEDSITFTVSPATGESYKLRAHDTKDRQMWINRLRVVTESHTRAISHNSSQYGSRELRVKETIAASSNIGGLAVIDAFTQVAELLEETQRQYTALTQSVEELPSAGTGIKYSDHNMLTMKAISQATLTSLDRCLQILHLQRSKNKSDETKESRRPSESPIVSSSPLTKSRSSSTTAPKPQCTDHSSLAVKNVNTTTDSENQPGSSSGTRIDISTVSEDELNRVLQDAMSDEDENDDFLDISSASSEVSDADDNGDHEQNAMEGQRSVIMHIISQLKLGMDLTRVTLPTFILEKRSLLEMFADFLGHPDLFLRINETTTPEERMLAVVRWYLTSIHVGRQGSVAKKPYNPIIGETFSCSWKVPSATESEPESKSAGESYQSVKYISEQVSHHPPVSAFFFECPDKRMCINAHVWTKSKFMGMSVGVNLIGDISLYLGDFSEMYSLAMPSAYARSVLTEPWVELGGRVDINCQQNSCSTSIVFHTKPFYGGKLHKVTAELKNSSGNIFCRVQGEWDAVLEFAHSNGKTETLSIPDMSLTCRKRVRPMSLQAPNESRVIWKEVTSSLLKGELETATNHKKELEDKQREGEAERSRMNKSFPTKIFSFIGERWIYNKLPVYAKSDLS